MAWMRDMTPLQKILHTLPRRLLNGLGSRHGVSTKPWQLSRPDLEDGLVEQDSPHFRREVIREIANLVNTQPMQQWLEEVITYLNANDQSDLLDAISLLSALEAYEAGHTAKRFAEQLLSAA